MIATIIIPANMLGLTTWHDSPMGRYHGLYFIDKEN